MSIPLEAANNLWNWIISGGVTMYPLVLCSIVVWGVIFERIWNYRRLGHHLRVFHWEATHILFQNDLNALMNLCQRQSHIPTAKLIMVALDRINSKDIRLREKWPEALERRRQLLNLELKQNLWILGTIASAAPFIGLFGTVVGILQSFRKMAQSGVGGFAVVAAGISEALIATAAGIIVAVVAVMAFNAFQTRWGKLVLLIRIQTEELAEMIAAEVDSHQHTS